MTWAITFPMTHSMYSLNVKFPFFKETTSSHISLFDKRTTVPLILMFQNKKNGEELTKTVLQHYKFDNFNIYPEYNKDNESMRSYFPSCVPVKLIANMKESNDDNVFFDTELKDMFEHDIDGMKKLMDTHNIPIFNIERFEIELLTLNLHGIIFHQDMNNYTEETYTNHVREFLEQQI